MIWAAKVIFYIFSEIKKPQTLSIFPGLGGTHDNWVEEVIGVLVLLP